MSETQPAIRGFKAVFTIIGCLYVLLASSMLVTGVQIMHDFAVPEHLTSEPVFQDFFYFFYELMAVIGLLIVLFGHVTRGVRLQTAVATSFAVLNVLILLRDLVTSDTRFGNHLYRGDKTLVFLYISLTLASIFGALALAGLRTLSASPTHDGRGVTS